MEGGNARAIAFSKLFLVLIVGFDKRRQETVLPATGVSDEARVPHEISHHFNGDTGKRAAEGS